jgi:hypothetical protein
MKKRRVPPSIPVTKSTETDNPPSEQTTPDEVAPTDGDSDWTIIKRQWQQLDWSLIWTILAVKGVILVFGVQSYLTWMNKPIEKWYGWLEIWNRWDSLRHIRLAQIGYTGVGSERADLIGFPLYPWLVRLFALIFQDYLISAFVVSGLALIAAGLLLHKLVLADFPDSTARNSVWFMLIFPTAYFLHINYNESLFIALTVGCFLAARQGDWSLAGMLGLLVCLTRLNGLVIFPALLVEAFLQYRTTRHWQWKWLWIFAAPLGFGIYLLVNQYAAADAFAFLTIGRENFQKSFSMPWNGIGGAYNLMWSPEITLAQMSGVQEFVFIVLGAVATVACGFLLRPSYTVWMAGNWFLFVSGGFILSVPRYTIVMFPIFILFARLAERRFWHSIITVWSLLLMALFITKFVQGHWAF